MVSCASLRPHDRFRFGLDCALLRFCELHEPVLATEPRHLSLADCARRAQCTACSDALVIAAGSPKEDEISFPKSLALHAALFQLELHDVILAFCHDKVAMRVSHTCANARPRWVPVTGRACPGSACRPLLYSCGGGGGRHACIEDRCGRAWCVLMRARCADHRARGVEKGQAAARLGREATGDVQVQAPSADARQD